jgi:hypothetical protein
MSPDIQSTWTNTLQAIASLILHNRGLREDVQLRWIWTKKTGGAAYQNGVGTRIVLLTHLVNFVDIEKVFYHELGHHVAGHCHVRLVDEPDALDEEHPLVKLQKMIDLDPASTAAEMLPMMQIMEEQAEKVGAELKAEFEARYGPLYHLLTCDVKS